MYICTSGRIRASYVQGFFLNRPTLVVHKRTRSFSSRHRVTGTKKKEQKI